MQQADPNKKLKVRHQDLYKVTEDDARVTNALIHLGQELAKLLPENDAQEAQVEKITDAFFYTWQTLSINRAKHSTKLRQFMLEARGLPVTKRKGDTSGCSVLTEQDLKDEEALRHRELVSGRSGSSSSSSSSTTNTNSNSNYSNNSGNYYRRRGRGRGRHNNRGRGAPNQTSAAGTQ
jgi:hypothetical protein